jgi:hypothetical protein
MSGWKLPHEPDLGPCAHCSTYPEDCEAETFLCSDALFLQFASLFLFTANEDKLPQELVFVWLEERPVLPQ